MFRWLLDHRVVFGDGLDYDELASRYVERQLLPCLQMIVRKRKGGSGEFYRTEDLPFFIAFAFSALRWAWAGLMDFSLGMLRNGKCISRPWGNRNWFYDVFI